MKWFKNLAAWMNIGKLALSPPALFNHLHSLDWYRGVMLDALPRARTNMAGLSVLEVGCATGDFCGTLVAMGATAYGVDRSAKMVQRAKLAHIAPQFAVADVLSLPFSTATFDIVFAASLINVVSDPVQALREMVRVCRPGGAIAFLVPAAEFSTAQARCWLEEQRLDYKDATAYMAWHRLAKKVSNHQLSQWMDDAALKCAHVESHLLLGGLANVIHLYPPANLQSESGMRRC